MNQLFQRVAFITLFYIILFINSFGQQIKNYREEFVGISKSVIGDAERVEKQKKYLISLKDEDLIIALSEISKLGDVNFIVYGVLPLIKEKFDNSDFRKQLLLELVNENNTPDYKAVLIDYLEKKKRDFPEQLNLMSDTYLSIANNIKLPKELRQMVASKVSTTSNHDFNKSRVKDMIRSHDIALINGASKTIKSYVRSENLRDETNEWVEELIAALENNKSNIKELTAPISTLGYTNSAKARTYLLSLFDEHKNSDIKFTETIVYSLSNNADTIAINKIINEYRQNNKYDNFSSDLTMKTLANNNIDIVEQLSKSHTSEAKINYLRMVKYFNEPTDKEKMIANCQPLLNDKSDEVRLETVKTLRFLLSNEEEEKIFREHLIKEQSQIVKNEIYSYIGR